MLKEGLIKELKMSRKCILNTTECIRDADGSYAPKEGMLTLTQQVSHVAHTIHWFLDGAFSGKGFDLDFESSWGEVNKVGSLSEAFEVLDKAYANAEEVISSKSEMELMAPLPEGPIMGGAPTFAIVHGISEHTAHHRGSLAVYARLLGKEPKMPYAD